MSFKEIFWTKEFGMFFFASIDAILKLVVVWLFCRACFKYIYGY